MSLKFADHSQCLAYTREFFAGQGIEITVSTEPPLVNGPYTEPATKCPHGIRFWFEPTGEQIAQWAKDRVP